MIGNSANKFVFIGTFTTALSANDITIPTKVYNYQGLIPSSRTTVTRHQIDPEPF